MAVDESILEACVRRHSLPTLRLYAWSPACLSLGHAQPLSDVDHVALQKNGWVWVRRPTGGRAVLHVDELTYSVIGHQDEPQLTGGVLPSYQRLAQPLLAALLSLGLQADSHASSASARGNTNPVCFEVPSAYEITVGGR